MSGTTFTVNQGGSLNGSINIPGDKSISHRSIMIGALAEGDTEIDGFLEGEDSLATLKAFRAMGVEIEGPLNGRVTIHGVGLNGLKAPAAPLDLGNSGTSMRLLTGIMAGQLFDVEMIGDQSLSARPMKRVTVPLGQMGARIESSNNGTPPLKVFGGQPLMGINYTMPMASAQVKSAVLLAGLYAKGKTTVREPAPTRDHTERMLKAFDYPVECNGGEISLTGGGKLKASKITVPGDISSAAFFMVGASIAEGSNITLLNVGMNPTRTGIINILRQMGANISLMNKRMAGGEPVADINVRSSKLKGIHIPEDQVPLAIDEFPVLFVAASCAEGTTVLSGAEELRVKESDRIAVMADGLVALGVDARPTGDGMVVNGGQISGGRVASHGDHRIAMAFSIAGLRANGAIGISDCENVATSFPGFVDLARASGLNILTKT
ncbi:MAG: 3-phosphoshikimate 1-carboxyvinyltransferase [Gammaproteobacteria bacterium]